MRAADPDAPGAWLPPGKRAAVCFSIDDVHPGRSTDAYEAGGDLGDGALGHLEWLLERHPDLRATLFVTADWREREPFVTRRGIARVPWLRERAWLAPVLPAGTMRLDRHPAFVEYLKGLPRTEIGLHGLHHVHRGPRIAVEFQHEDAGACRQSLRTALAIFSAAGLPRPEGMTPPGWDLTPGLASAMADTGLAYAASARDIMTPVSADAVTAMSGLRGVPMLRPHAIESGRLVHVPANFQATSPIERAEAIAEAGGLVSVKAHIIKSACGHVALDGLDELYRNYLDLVFALLRRRFGDSLWWATIAQVAERARTSADRAASSAAP